jgi:hypothetical protein
MKKARKTDTRTSGRARRASATKSRAKTQRSDKARKALVKSALTSRGKGVARPATKRPAKSTHSLAARVLSRRAAEVASRPQAVPAPKKPTAAVASAPGARHARPRRSPTARPGRSTSPQYRANRELARASRMPQFAYMRAPGLDSAFNVGDAVEVFCDHELDSERVRGWVRGVVVQVDNKLVAVQFRSNVFLTDGWMVPDRILWYSLTSDQIRTAGLAKKGSRKAIVEY